MKPELKMLDEINNEYYIRVLQITIDKLEIKYKIPKTDLAFILKQSIREVYTEAFTNEKP
jgi:hypothetical protein